MSESINDGGPAFPTQNGCRSDEGMSLRDWFAGHAMVGHLSCQSVEVGYYTGSDCNEKIAYDAYRTADAMIEARKGGVDE